MDTYPRFRRCLAVGSIILFVGTSILPIITQDTGKAFLSTPRENNLYFETTLAPLPPPTRWMKIFGGDWSDGGYSVQQTTDGGYIITGYNNWSHLTLRSYAWLIKTDGNGNVVWEKSFVEPGAGYCVQQTSDGGYIIVGNSPVWLIKTDATGSTVWTTIFTETDKDYYGYVVQQTTDGGYIIIGEAYVGYNGLDFWLLKTDSAGHKIWSKTFGGTGYEECSSGQQTSDGGYILAGSTSDTNSGLSDVWLIKTDNNGDMEWNKTFGGADDEWGHAVQQTIDGGYIITGETIWIDPSILLIKTDGDGNTMWENIFEENRHDYGTAIQETTDGGYIIIGQTWINDSTGYDILLMKTDDEGNKIWYRTFGKTKFDEGRSVQQTTDSGYILVGEIYVPEAPWSDLWLIKTDEQGFVSNPPNTPSITGKTKGSINTYYYYTIHTTDPDQDDVQYYIDWGDNTTTITDFNESGEEIIVLHTWETKGTYNVKVKAIDENDGESDWATLTVTMPYSHNLMQQFFELFFQRFPYAFPIHRQLMSC